MLLNYNGWSDTIECLESLLRADYPNLRVLVVDNASTDGSLERMTAWAEGREPFQPPLNANARTLTSPPIGKPVDHVVIAENAIPAAMADELPTVTFLSSASNKGFAGGNNIALRLLLETQPESYACVINNDMVVAPDVISALVRRIERDPQLAAVGGVILDYAEPDLVQTVGGGTMSRLGTSHVIQGGAHRNEIAREPAEVGYVSGGLLIATVETLRAVGLLEEEYFLYAEDCDWGERMRRHGRLATALDAFVWHKGSSATGAKSPFQDYHLVRSALTFVRRHAPVFLPASMVYLGALTLLPKIVRGQWTRARAVLRAYGDFAASGRRGRRPHTDARSPAARTSPTP